MGFEDRLVNISPLILITGQMELQVSQVLVTAPALR